MKTSHVAAFLLLALPQLVNAQAADDPHAKLAFFEGTWTVKGQELTYRETCSWSESRRFLVCKAEDKEDGTSSWTMSIFGYAAERQAYTHTLFAPAGGVRTIHGWVDGKTWIFTGETQQGASTRRMHITIVPTKKGFTFRLDISANGGPWTKAADFTYIRLQ